MRPVRTGFETDPNNTGYRELAFAMPLTPHRRHGRIVLVVEGYLLDEEIGEASASLVLPDRFDRWAQLLESMGPLPEDPIKQAVLVAAYGGAVELRRETVESEAEIESFARWARTNAPLFDARAGELLDPSVNQLRARLGETPGSKWILDPDEKDCA